MTARLLRDRNRRKGIGASEVPAIAGASPFQTPVGVWMEKVGLADGQPDSDSMRAGRELEPTLLRAGAFAAGVELKHNAQTFRHPDYPKVPLYATPDGFGRGRRLVAEVKLVGHRASDWRDGPPDYVALQVQAQLACVPQATSALVIALLGAEVRTFQLARDADAQASIPGLVADWWARHVTGGVAPEATSPGDQWSVLRGVVAGVGARSERLATPDELADAEKLADLLTMRAGLETAVDEYRLALAERARDSDVIGPDWVARWSQRTSIDWKAVARELGIDPDVIARHTRRTPVFGFRRTATEDDQ